MPRLASILCRVLLPAAVVAALPLRAQVNLPPPPVPAGNPITPGKAMLGKALFWDEQLASSNALACGSCHVLGRDGTDPRAVLAVHPGYDGAFGTADDVHGSPGVPRHDAGSRLRPDPHFGVQWRVTPRRAPSVINTGYARSLFVDGRAGDTFRDPVTGAVLLATDAALENQAAAPLLGPEMGHDGRTWNDVVTLVAGLTPLAIAESVPPSLQQFVGGHTYATLFAQVYGSPGVTPARLLMALATYQRTLVSDGSPFDRYLAGTAPLPPAALRGLVVFGKHCSGCHTDLGPSVFATGPVLDDFRNIGVRPPHEDEGRAAVTGQATDRGRFRVPGLRNVALRTTFFHDGSQHSLRSVLEFYARGGDFTANQDPLVAAMAGKFNRRELDDLLALLHSLTDPRVAAELPPFDRPRLWLEGPLLPFAFGNGTGRPGQPPPRIAALGTAYVGSDVFGVGIDRVAPGVFTALMVDLVRAPSPVQVHGLQIYLAQSPALLALPLGLSSPSPDGLGYHSHVFHVPPANAAPGTYWLQWVCLDPGAPTLLVSSNAMRMVVR